MGYQKVMSDGTVCRTGPQCKRHGMRTSGVTGLLSSLKAQIVSRQEERAPDTGYVFGQYVDETFTRNKTITGMNGADKPNPILEQLDAESLDYEASIDKELRDTITHYISSYEYVNNYLREGEAGIAKYLDTFTTGFWGTQEHKNDTLKEYTRLAQQRIAKMDEAFSTYERPQKNTRKLYRSEIVPENVSTEEYLSKYLPGQKITTKSYYSTSTDPDYMLVMNNPKENSKRIVVFEILSKEGIPVHKKGRSTSFIQGIEREVLLNRETTFTVTNVANKKFVSSYPNGKPNGSHGRDGVKSAEYVVIQLQADN